MSPLLNGTGSFFGDWWKKWVSFSRKNDSSKEELIGPKKYTCIMWPSDFRKMVKEKLPIVDKTLFIKNVMENMTETNVITRPRRFGKSTSLSMLYYFLAKDLPYQNENLFEGFEISKDEQFCRKHQNNHPVLYMNFKNVTASTYEQFQEHFKAMVVQLYLDHGIILRKSKSLPKDYIIHIQRVASGNLPDYQHTTAIPSLMKYLELHYNKSVIVLLDEYDDPVQEAYANNFYPIFISKYRAIMTSIFKDNPFLKKGVIIGITQVAKESIFSAASNLKMNSVLDNAFDTVFGFLDEEIDWLASKFDLNPETLKAGLKTHYNGYHVGDAVVFNPLSVIECLCNGGKLIDSWVLSGDMEAFYRTMFSYGVLPIIKSGVLLEGGEIQQTFRHDLVYLNIDKEEDFFWTYVLQAGYLTVSERLDSSVEGVICKMKIPNDEIKSVFKALTEKYRNRLKIEDYKELCRSIKGKDKTKANRIMTRYLQISESVFDGNDRIITTAEILQGFQNEFGPIRQKTTELDTNMIVMERELKRTQFLIKTVNNVVDLDNDTNDSLKKTLFKGFLTGGAIATGAQCMNVLIAIYHNNPHFYFFQ